MVTSTLAVTEPTAPADTRASVVKVTEPPTATSTVVLILPVPVAALQFEPTPEAAHVQLPTGVSVAGKVTATAAPLTVFGPEFETTMEYELVVP